MGIYQIKEVKDGFMFNLIAANGEIIGTSEHYVAKAGCHTGIKSVQHNAPIAPVEDQTAGESAPAPKFQLYKDAAEQFRFRLIAANGEIILASEGYTTKQHCHTGIASVKTNADSAVAE